MDDKSQFFREKYSSGVYNFLRIINLSEQEKLFLEKNIELPIFSYKKYFNLARFDKRSEDIHCDIRSIEKSDGASRSFLKLRAEETELLRLLAMSQERNLIESELKEFNRLANSLYGSIDKKLYQEALRYVLNRSEKTDQRALGQEIVRSIDLIPAQKEIYTPPDELFKKTSKEFNREFPKFLEAFKSIEPKDEIDNKTAIDIIKNSMDILNAQKYGWRIRIIRHSHSVHILPVRKLIAVGFDYRPKNLLRLKQVVAHELYGHMLRSINSQLKSKYLVDEEEGIAIVCEQIVAKSFSPKRIIRYLLVGAAIGVDNNKSRTFRDVYELAWRLFVVIGNMNIKVAKQRAFYETARVFRGGDVSGGGIILPKDAIYLMSNIRIWQKIEADYSQYNIRKLLMLM